MQEVPVAYRAHVSVSARATHLLTAAAVALALALVACGGGADPAPSSSAADAARTYSKLSTYAGSGDDGSVDSPDTTARAAFRQPLGVAADGLGNVYVADTLNHKIRKISYDGHVVTLAGSGVAGFANGIGDAASFNEPRGVAVGDDLSVYVADYGNHAIRKISPTGVVTTLAGTGRPGSADGATAGAQFNGPGGVALIGDAVYVADTLNHKVRRVLHSGVVETVAGTGQPGGQDGLRTIASFNAPTGIAIDVSGVVFVSDSGNYKIRKIARDGSVSTFAGTGSGGIHPAGLALVPSGNGTLYVADFDSHVIRKITADGVVSVLAGSGRPGSSGGAGSSAEFNGPYGVAATFDGSLYVADSLNNGIRKLLASGGLVDSAGVVRGLAGTGSAGASDGFVTATVSFRSLIGATVGPDGSVYAVQTSPGVLRKVGPDGGVHTVWRLAQGAGLLSAAAIGPDGTAYAIDGFNQQIVKRSADGGTTVVAGSPQGGSADGPGLAAGFASPSSLVVSKQGTLFVSDTYNHKIRKISPEGVVTTLAGRGTPGAADGPADTAEFNQPSVLALDAIGNVYVYDSGNHRVRKISPAGAVTTVAGNTQGHADGQGAAAAFDIVMGMVAGPDGSLYVSDTFNHAIRKVSATGLVTTLAGYPGARGSVDGDLSSARLFGPAGLAISADGSLFVADLGNNKIRKLD